MITVMGATGNTGRRITERLLKAGEKVRGLGRAESKLSQLRSAGAETMAGDATDAAFLTQAFAGSDAVYTLIPPDPQSKDFRAKQDKEGIAIIKAIRENDIKYVVFLSSIGADLPTGTGPIVGLHVQEERLRELANTNVLVIRAAAFFENFYPTLGVIKHQGISGGAMLSDRPVPMIATRDIAEFAAKALKDRNWRGFVVRELLGPRDLTFAEATHAIGERIGKPDLKYVQFPYEDMAKSLMQMGLSENMAGLYVEMTRAFNEGKVKSREGRKPENTTPTRFEDFTGELARAYQATP